MIINTTTYPTVGFFRCVHLSGLELWAWLTNAQLYGAQEGECWNEERIVAFEDRAGEMVPHDVLVADLTPVAEA